jgi:uncharacterized membrane-anchored protein
LTTSSPSIPSQAGVAAAAMRRWGWPLVGLVAVFTMAAWLILQGERRINEGTVVFLELRPVDPRALLQGDYMALDYAVAREAGMQFWSPDRTPPELVGEGDAANRTGSTQPPTPPNVNGHPPTSGKLVLRLDETRIGRFARFASGAGDSEQLAEGEVLLNYRTTETGLTVGSNAWYFQEGDAELYVDAEYAEYRVVDDGSAVLVSLRDADLQPLGKPLR